MLYPALGHSSANDIQMDGLRSSKHVSVQEAINNSKGLTSLRPLPQCPMDHHTANVHFGDSPWIEVKARQCPLCFPSWKT
jgi:hypothetical protein